MTWGQVCRLTRFKTKPCVHCCIVLLGMSSGFFEDFANWWKNRWRSQNNHVAQTAAATRQTQDMAGLATNFILWRLGLFVIWNHYLKPAALLDATKHCIELSKTSTPMQWKQAVFPGTLMYDCNKPSSNFPTQTVLSIFILLLLCPAWVRMLLWPAHARAADVLWHLFREGRRNLNMQCCGGNYQRLDYWPNEIA